MRKVFPCGHTGKGKYCHTCRDAEVRLQDAAARKSEWQARLAAATIELGHLPKNIAIKALDIMDAIAAGRPHTEFGGKRLSPMGQREVISIPLGQRYRLICVERAGRREFVEAISHETYNTRIASGGWV